MAADLTDEAALERRVARRVFIIMTLFLVAIGVLNAFGILTEAQREGRVLDPRVPFILELTSVLAMVALAPLVILFERRVPFTAETWRSALLWHALGSIVFSLLHVALFIVLRSAAYAAILGTSYTFFTDTPTDQMIELWRAITCPMLLLWGKDSFATSPATDGRLQYFPTARLIEYENAGHWLHHDQFDRFMNDVKAFLA